MTGFEPRPETVEKTAHCPAHERYECTCPACVTEKMRALGLTPCGHTMDEGCTGHGDF